MKMSLQINVYLLKFVLSNFLKYIFRKSKPWLPKEIILSVNVKW